MMPERERAGRRQQRERGGMTIASERRAGGTILQAQITGRVLYSPVRAARSMLALSVAHMGLGRHSGIRRPSLPTFHVIAIHRHIAPGREKQADSGVDALPCGPRW